MYVCVCLLAGWLDGWMLPYRTSKHTYVCSHLEMNNVTNPFDRYYAPEDLLLSDVPRLLAAYKEVALKYEQLTRALG